MKNTPFDLYDFFGYIASGILIVIGLELTIGFPEVLGRELLAFEIVALSLGVYVAGQIIATPAKWLLETIIVRRILKPPSINLMRSRDKGWWTKVWWWWLFPGYYEPLPNSVQKRILKKAKDEGLDNPVGEDLFVHIRFQDYMRTDEVLMNRLRPFLNKYGFNRNLSFTSFLFGIALMAVTGWDTSTVETKSAILALVSGALLFLRYLKFYRQYSYELFNTYGGK